MEIARAAYIERELRNLLSRTTKVLSDMLDIDLVEILERLPDDGWLLVQGEGWRDGLVGDRVADNGDSPMGIASKQDNALVLADQDTTARGGGTSRLPAHWPSHNVRSSALVRIGEPGRAWGVLAMHSCSQRTFHREELGLIEDLGEILGHAIRRQDERENLEQETRRAIEAKDEISALYRVSRTVLEGGSLESTLQAATEQCRHLVNASVAVLARVEPGRPLIMEQVSPQRSTPDFIQEVLRVAAEELPSIPARRPTWHNDLETADSDDERPVQQGLKNLLLAPVTLEHGTMALLILANRKGGFASRDGAISSSFATLAALAMDRHAAWEQAHFQRRLVHQLADLALDALKPFDILAVAARALSVVESETGAGWGVIFSKDPDGPAQILAADECWSPPEEPSPRPVSSKSRQGARHWAASSNGDDFLGIAADTVGTLVDEVLREGRTMEIDRIAEGERLLPGCHPDMKNLLLVPLQTAGRILGALALADVPPRRLADAKRWSEMLVRPLALAIQAHQEERRAHLLEKQLRRAQRLESVGRLAGGVAHDFNNLLTAIMSYTDMVMRQLGPQHSAYADLQEVLDASDRAAQLTKQLLAFSRRQVLSPKTIDINTVVSGMKGLLGKLLGEHIEILMELCEKPGLIKADPGQLEQVLMNLVVNARDAMPKGGRLIIETDTVSLDESYCRSHSEVAPGRYTMLAVTDTGVGMDSETMAQIFDPFFTTKEPGQGTGLGLSTVYGIVKQSGGSVWCYSEPGRGTTFKVYLPTVSGTAPTPLADGDDAVGTLGGRETILIAEDEAAVRHALSRILEQAGYEVLTAGDGKQALAVAERHEGTIDLLLTDVIMPGMNGRVLGERLARMRPVKVLYISGYTDNAVAHAGILDDDVQFLAKPFSRQTILETVRKVLDSPKGDDDGSSGHDG